MELETLSDDELISFLEEVWPKILGEEHPLTRHGFISSAEVCLNELQARLKKLRS